jgi:predicted O-linked N-acetylglucosamine transferase (SPINDLY family)
MATIETQLRHAADLHRKGDLPKAEKAYRAILARHPAQPEASHSLGALLARSGRHREAMPFLKAALEAAPGQARFWIGCIDALVHLGQADVARRLLEQGMQRGLRGPEADVLAKRLGLGLVAGFNAPTDPHGSGVQNMLELLGRQRFAELEERARAWLDGHATDGLVWKMLAVACKNLGKDADALAAIEQAARYAPDDFEAHYNLGNARYEAEQFDLAEQSFRRAAELNPRHAETRSNLGQTLLKLGRTRDAEQQLRAALGLNPDLVVAHNNLGNLLSSWREYAQAETHYRQALTCEPGNAEVVCNLAIAHYDQSRFDEAEALTRTALTLDATFAGAHRNLGHILQSKGDFRGAEECFKNAIRHDPRSLANYDSYLFTLNYDPDLSESDVFDVYREFDKAFGLPLRSRWPSHSNDRSIGRRLRIGYMSPDLRQHTVASFLEPLLANHDHDRFDIFAYAELDREDHVTARFRGYADHWRSTFGLSDEQVCGQIERDRIDILVDLAGHTTGHRLMVFARKPAPVSLTWLGYGYTTGVSAIDYFLADPAMVPPGSERLFAERPWLLEAPSFAFRPLHDMGDPGPLPALSRGHVTLGTLTRSVRINHRVVRVWSEILKQLPGARLVIDSGHFKEPGTQEVLAGRFAAHGIDRERLAIGCHSPPWDVLRGMDIGLDCFPHNSGTTLFESLYMGVPFVTLAGRPSVGRLGSSILTGLGHPEWIAASEAEYVAKVVALAGDLPRLAAIRAGLRPAMQASALMDEAGFTRRVEAAYREMFKRWAEQAT